MVKLGFSIVLFLACGPMAVAQDNEYNELSYIQLNQTITANQQKITQQLEEHANTNFQSVQLIEAHEGIKCAKKLIYTQKHILSLAKDQLVGINNDFITIQERGLRTGFLKTHIEAFELCILNFKPFTTEPYKGIAVLNFDAPGFHYHIRNLKKCSADADQVVSNSAFPSLKPLAGLLKEITLLNMANVEERRRSQDIVDQATNVLEESYLQLKRQSAKLKKSLYDNALEVQVLAAGISVRTSNQKEYLDKLVKLLQG